MEFALRRDDSAARSAGGFLSISFFWNLLRSFIADGVFDLASYLSSMECIDGDHEAAEAFMQTRMSDAVFDCEMFAQSLQGRYDSEQDFALYLAKVFLDAPDRLLPYIGLEKMARDAFGTDYEYVNGYVFREV